MSLEKLNFKCRAVFPAENLLQSEKLPPRHTSRVFLFNATVDPPCHLGEAKGNSLHPELSRLSSKSAQGQSSFVHNEKYALLQKTLTSKTF